MDREQAHTYLRAYQAMVGSAYMMYEGRERARALLRAWTYYAQPLIDEIWREEYDLHTVTITRELIGWLWWLRDLYDPAAYFRGTDGGSQNRRAGTICLPRTRPPFLG